MAARTDVTPISIPNIAWDRYVLDVSALSGHSPTFTIDSSTVPLADYAKYIVSLDELQNGQTGTALEILRNESNPLNHLFFSFLFVCSRSTLFRIMETTDLNVLSAKKKISVVSGTLRQWRDALVTYQNTKETRQLFNRCLYFFVKMGLGNIWDSYRKHTMGDDTFLLEYKNEKAVNYE